MTQDKTQPPDQLAKLQSPKMKSRGASCDMTPKAISRRLDIVDELRELARDLQNAKRLGPIDSQ